MRFDQRLGVLASASAIILLDQAAKAWVLSAPVFNARACLHPDVRCGYVELGPLFDLSMVWNRGVSFGLMQSGGFMGVALLVGSGLIAVGFAAWMLKAPPMPTGYTLALIVGGAVGNLIDRIRFSAVIDFLDFSGLYFPFVFNVADACITVGALGLIVSETLAREPKGE